ncbi:MAG: formylglycine-generating enzyme family protein [Candidatus Riflebacteria bacterium]|nr:formylglycine-generating enzyme family protein [Candidatus Riflebacteria bacterium]
MSQDPTTPDRPGAGPGPALPPLICPNCGEAVDLPEEERRQRVLLCSKCSFPLPRQSGQERTAAQDLLDATGANFGWIAAALVALAFLVIIQAWGPREAGPPEARPPSLTNSVGMRLVLVPAGTFRMGSRSGSADEQPVREVTIRRPFYLGATEVTNEQFTRVMQQAPFFPNDPPSNPVVFVSWHQAKDFCLRLSVLEKATYRLPTEAEWEYACRAGTTTDFFWGDAWQDGFAWAHPNSGRPTRSTHPVGTLKPNGWGLYDMSGNVGEWCEDVYAPAYLPGDVADPKGPPRGDFRVVRGGAYDHTPEGVRSAARGHHPPGEAAMGPGFRVVMELPPAAPATTP